MDNKSLEQKWPDIRNKILTTHPDLKQEELVYQIGKEEELLRTLGEKLKMNRAEIDKWLSLMG